MLVHIVSFPYLNLNLECLVLMLHTVHVLIVKELVILLRKNVVNVVVQEKLRKIKELLSSQEFSNVQAITDPINNYLFYIS